MTDAELESFLTGLRAMRRVRTEAMSEPNGHPAEREKTR
jgi:hypothetical protein